MLIFLDEWRDIKKEDIDIIYHGKRHFYEYESIRIKKKTKTKFECVQCGKTVEREFFYTKNFDLRCETCKIKQTKFDKYGDENAFNFGSNEFKNIMNEKYGVINISQTEEQKMNIRKNKNIPLYGSNKCRQLMFNRFGVDYPIQSEVIRNKIENTNIERYGSKNPSNSKIVMDNKIKNYLKQIDFKLKENNLLRLFSDNEYHGTKKLHLFRYSKCNNEFEAYLRNGILPKFYNCNKKQTVSYCENELSSWLKENGVETKLNKRDIIPPKELDIYIPSHNIAIEFDDLYWHSDIYKDKKYHLEKTLACKEQGIRLIHIFEDEWMYKQDIVKARLKNILGLNTKRIGARQTIIKEIEPSVKNEFLEKYHIQGKDNCRIKLGAFYKNELIGVMTFSKPRLFMNQKKKDKRWELSRFAIIPGTYTPGLASKMLKHFERNYDWDEIYSYADRRWSQGNLYKSIGFEFEHYTDPNYWYWKNQANRYHRYNFKKQNLKEWDNYSSDKTEKQIMDEAGWHRIYDYGNIKFVK